MSTKRPTKRQAFAYLRVSGMGQVRGDGFDRQRETCAAYAKGNNIEIVGTYEDKGVSGAKDLDDRPGLAALLDELNADGVKLILVERADRLARDLMVSEIILSQLRGFGVTCIEAAGGTDLTAADGDPTRTLIRQVLGAVSQFEKSVIVLKLRAARARIRRQAGRCEGRKPFGTRPGEQATINRMLQLRRKRFNGRAWSYARIAKTLTAEGLLSRSGKPWQDNSVRGIIHRVRRTRAKRPAQSAPAS